MAAEVLGRIRPLDTKRLPNITKGVSKKYQKMCLEMRGALQNGRRDDNKIENLCVMNSRSR